MLLLGEGGFFCLFIRLVLLSGIASDTCYDHKNRIKINNCECNQDRIRKPSVAAGADRQNGEQTEL